MKNAASDQKPLVLALPKGRILKELRPVLTAVGIIPEADFDNADSRRLRFSTNRADLEIVRVRSFDVATFVAYGAAQLGVAGSDVLAEFDYSEIYAPLALGIGKCRLSVAEPAWLRPIDDPAGWSRIRIATKYPALTRQYFSKRGVQADCVHLSGAMELAPGMGLCRRIVDLVSSGATLKDNGLVEVETVMQVESKLIVNRVASKMRASEIAGLVDQFSAALESSFK